jgi:hypothetical protein
VIYIQWLDTLLSGRGAMPELWRLRALATGLRTDLDTVRNLAIAQWLDYWVTDLRTPSETIIIPVKRPISPATRRKIERLVSVIMEEDAEEA